MTLPQGLTLIFCCLFCFKCIAHGFIIHAHTHALVCMITMGNIVQYVDIWREHRTLSEK